MSTRGTLIFRKELCNDEKADAYCEVKHYGLELKCGEECSLEDIFVDKNIHKRAGDICKEMGLSLETAIRVFLIKVTNERRIPFEVSAPPE